MNPNRIFALRKIRITLPIILGVVSILFAGIVIGQQGSRGALFFVEILLGVALTAAILREPYLGIVITAVSLPILDIIPSVPYLTSAISLFGGITLIASALLVLPKRGATYQALPGPLKWGALFVLWIFLSNPYASLLPDDAGRSWLFTFVQLIILSWLASKLLDTPQKHHFLMWAFSLVTTISALYAIQGGLLAATVKDSMRSAGLAGEVNSAARYFVVGLTFLYYLSTRQKGLILRSVLFICMGIVFYGLIATVSRTGLLLLVAAFGFFFIFRQTEKQRLQTGLILIVALVVVWFFANNVISIFQSILPSIQQGTDTVGVRYGLWQAGLRMWAAHPFAGIGIGQYPIQLSQYGWDLLSPHYLSDAAHNMYVQVLAETGIIGLFFFLFMLGSALYSSWKIGFSKDANLDLLAQTWFVALALMMLGGITKNDQYDKLIWLAVGVSSSRPLQQWKDVIGLHFNHGAIPKLELTGIQDE